METEFYRVSESLFNIPVGASLDEIVKRFRDNFQRLRVYLDRMDTLSKETTLADRSKSRSGALVQELRRTLDTYSEVAKTQGNTLRALYCPRAEEGAANPIATFKTVSEDELERMWKSINDKRTTIELSQKILVLFEEREGTHG